MNLIQNKKIIGFAAYSGTGKTTLIKEIIKILKELDYRVSVIKHAHHDFDIDLPGKDSYEIRKSGAENMLVSSKNRWALMHENNYHDELSLVDLLGKLDNLKYDLILIEGFKTEPFPKIELYREEINKNRGLLSESDENIVAIATESATKLNTNLTVLDINKPQNIVNFIINFLDIYK
tara:strand:- start:2767 stop:3300 length:534 start_codon:yes stop_codon:yes gene_type:complete